MPDSKFFRQLRALKPAEKQRFLAFADSEYFNPNQQLRELVAGSLGVLEQEGKRNSAARKRSESLHSNPDLLNQGVRLMEKFLAAEVLLRDQNQVRLGALQAMSDRNMERDFEFTMRQLRKTLDRPPWEDETLYRQLFQLESLADAHFAKAARRSQDDSLRDRLEALDRWYILEKLKAACELLNRARIMGGDSDTILIEEICGRLEADWEHWRQVAPVAIWLKVFRMLEKPELEYSFHDLLQAMKDSGGSLAPEEYRQVSAYAQNYAIRRVNAGDERWLRQLFELYRSGLERTRKDGTELPQSTYKNIVTTGLRLGEHDWTLDFIEDCKSLISSSSRQNAYRYNLANWHYANGNSDRALELLREVEFADVFYDVGAKTMLLKIYYEEGLFEPLQALCDAFRVWLKRNRQLSGAQKRSYSNLIGLTLSMARLKQRSPYFNKTRSKKEHDKIEVRLQDGRPVMNVGWVRDQLAELRPA